jgi:uncharacterized protein (DUF362 family)
LSKVAVVKGRRGVEPVYRALDLVDYGEALRGWDRVLVKVNFITTKNWETGATTDPIVVEAIIDRVRELKAEVYVVESDATMTNADKAYVASGMKEMCDRKGVPWINLRHAGDRVKIDVPEGSALKSVEVPRMVRDSAIVSAAKMKTHTETGVTLGMKNMFGLLPDKFKGKYHLKGIDKVILDINTALRPRLTVIDGFVAMEGRGPVGGRPVKMDLIIAGTDPVATDATAARIMGFDPHLVNHISSAHDRGLGEIDGVEVLGERLEDVTRVFERF